jgi:hypothetical protein
VPDRIHDVLMARIDRLAAEPKRAIQIAAVIGREFALRLLARIHEVGDKASSLVEDLRAVELDYEKAVHPELAYMFKHALTHDVAYASVLVQRRKQLHRTIGLAIEELYADRLAEHYETLAHHFESGEAWERALEYHERRLKAGSLREPRQARYAAALAIAERRRAVDALPLRAEEPLAWSACTFSEFVIGDAFERAAGSAGDASARDRRTLGTARLATPARPRGGLKRPRSRRPRRRRRCRGPRPRDRLPDGARRHRSLRHSPSAQQRIEGSQNVEITGRHFMQAELEWRTITLLRCRTASRFAIGRSALPTRSGRTGSWQAAAAWTTAPLALLDEGRGLTERIGDRA